MEFNRYAHRNKVLVELGFASYADYLASDLWQSIKARVFKRDKGKCQSCGKQATQVHHKHYSKKVLAGTHIQGLKSVCRECHVQSEFDGTSKVDVVTANRRMRSIGERNGLVRPLCRICRKNPTKRNAKICRRCKREGTQSQQSHKPVLDAFPGQTALIRQEERRLARERDIQMARLESRRLG